MGLLIRDGFNQTDEFKGQGHIPPFKFTYRPALPERVYEYRGADKVSGKAAIRENTKLILEHFVSWDVTEKDEIIKMDADTLKRVPSIAIDFIAGCICGYGPDQDFGADAKNS